MSGSGSKPKVVIPEVRIEWWMRKARVDQCVSTRADPAVIRAASATVVPEVTVGVPGQSGQAPSPTDVIATVNFDVLRDGVHVRFYARESRPGGSPELHIVMKKPDMRRMTSGLLAAIAYGAEAPDLPNRWNLRGEWVRKMYEKLEEAAESRGVSAFNGLSQPFMEALVLCRKSLDKAFGTDVDDLTAGVQKAFQVLVDHMEEEDVVRMWREAVAARVLRS